MTFVKMSALLEQQLIESTHEGLRLETKHPRMGRLEMNRMILSTHPYLFIEPTAAQSDEKSLVPTINAGKDIGT